MDTGPGCLMPERDGSAPGTRATRIIKDTGKANAATSTTTIAGIGTAATGIMGDTGAIGIMTGTGTGDRAVESEQEKRMTNEEMQAELDRLKAENDALKQQKTRAGSMKVSEKGALSVYGLGRFPVTLYQEQWLKLLGMADEIKAFIEENRSRLKVKE